MPTLTALGTALGGGIAVDSGSLQITDSAIQGNFAHGVPALTLIDYFLLPTFDGASTFGGGLFVTNATASIARVTIAGNSAVGGDGIESYYYGGGEYYGGNGGEAAGGGLYSSGGSLTVVNVTVSDNTASGGAGGNCQCGSPNAPTHDGLGGPSLGGGIALEGGAATFVNDTVVGNSASGGVGGGYTTDFFHDPSIGDWVIGWSPDYQASTYGGGLGTASGTATLYNTIVALNTTDIGLDGGTISSASAYNLIGTGGSGDLVDGVNGNQVGVADPGLGALADNGGPTQTIALLPGSPAINAGSNALAVDPSTGQPLTTDQRGPGFARIVGGAVDIGAFEVKSTVAAAVTIGWGSHSVTLQTDADGLRLLPAGRNTDVPWLGINQVQINLSQAATLSASDITVIGLSGTNYGVLEVTGAGTSYTITFAQAIDRPDRVTITIGNALIATFARRLDVLPGDINDDGVVNVQDMLVVRNQMLGMMGAMPTLFGDINGDGVIDINDYNAVRKWVGKSL